MLHPLLQLIATQPHLLADHAQAYANLVTVEVEELTDTWRRRAFLVTVATLCMALAVGLAGVAILLWSALPASLMRAPWALVAVPSILVAASVACMLVVRSERRSDSFGSLRQQVRADLMMLREMAVL